MSRRVPPDFRPRRVLIIRPRGLGDVVLSTAVVGALRRAYPDSAIDFLTEPASRDLLETDDRLDRIFLLGGSRLRGGRVQGGGTTPATLWMRGGGTDLVVDLFSNPRTAILTALSGARYRVGLDRSARRVAYNVRVPRFLGVPEEDHRYAREVQLDVLRCAGIEWEGEVRPGIQLLPEDRRFARDFLGEHGLEPRFLTAVLPGGSWESKRWAPEGFVHAGRLLAERSRTPVLVLWGPPEAEDAKVIACGLGESAVLAPPTRLRQMAALLEHVRFLVSTDCLGRHLAIVGGVPTVGIFGTTDPRDWTPKEGPHRTIRGSAEEGYESLRDLPPDPVLAEIRALLDELGPSPLDSAGTDA